MRTRGGGRADDVPIVREIDVEKFDVEAQCRVVNGLYLVLSEHQTLRYVPLPKVGRDTRTHTNAGEEEKIPQNKTKNKKIAID